ncbi:NACHT domain-containing NTPase [Catenulispora sp. EB89]|uniref:NACHT domain-containing protein n=1 Tax=Catenulispora sp. EB89 TaxID=3156257 RepID=UPI003511E059
MSEPAAAVAETLVKTLAVYLIPQAWIATLAAEAAAAAAGGTLRGSEERRNRQELEKVADGIARTSVTVLQLAGPNEDLTGAVYAVRDTLDAVPVGPELISETGFSADRLYHYYLEKDPGRTTKAMLGETDWAYHRMLREVSVRMIGVLQRSDAAQSILIGTLADQVRHITEALDYPLTLHRGIKQIDDAHSFLLYRDYAGRRLASRQLRLNTRTVAIPVQATYVEPRALVNGVAAPLTEVLGTNRRVLITGGPGSGKTMLLQHLFHRTLAHERLDGTPSWNSIVPIYVDLKDRAGLPPLGDVPKELYSPLVHIPGWWAQDRAYDGKAVILLDGVESALANTGRGPENLADLEDWLTTSATKSAFVIAARHGTVQQDWLSAHGFTVAELQPLHIDDLHRLVAQWHGAVADQFVTVDERQAVLDRGEQLITGLGKVSVLAEMMCTPLIATLVCEEFLESDLDLPQDWIDLVDSVLRKMAARDAGNTPAPAGQSPKLAIDVHRWIAEWCLHNSASMDPALLSETMASFTKTDPPPGAAAFLDQVFAHYSILRHTDDGMSFVSDAVRDHLAARALVDKKYVGFFRDEAQTPRHAKVAVAGAGRLNQDSASQLITTLLNEVDEGGPGAAALAAVACCAAQASRTIKPAVLKRAVETARRLIPPANGDCAGLLDVATHVLDTLTSVHLDDEVCADEVVACAVAVARHIGDPALLALKVIAAKASPEGQELLWGAWTSFGRQPYARLVLSQLHAPPGPLAIHDSDEAEALRYLPDVTTIELTEPLPAVLFNGRTDLTIRVARLDLILDPQPRDPAITIELVGENEGHHGVS